MQKFKIGDRVRRINSSCMRVEIGDIGIITGFENNNYSLDIGNPGFGHSQFNLELVKEKFKLPNSFNIKKNELHVGDLVLYGSDNEFCGEIKLIGDSYASIKSKENNHNNWNIILKDDGYWSSNLNDGYLQRFIALPPFKIKINLSILGSPEESNHNH